MPVFVGCDLGTLGTKAAVIDEAGQVLGEAFEEVTLYFSPEPGLVEQDLAEIERLAHRTIRRALDESAEACRRRGRGRLQWPDGRHRCHRRPLRPGHRVRLLAGHPLRAADRAHARARRERVTELSAARPPIPTARRSCGGTASGRTSSPASPSSSCQAPTWPAGYNSGG